jgi:hypothetical protein
LPEIVAQQDTETLSPQTPRPSDDPLIKGSNSSQEKHSTEQSLLTYTDDELDSAFNQLVEKGLLTSGDKAKLQQPLTRITVAELFVNIALTNDLQRDSDKDCTFPDMQTATEKEINIAKLACQFNIMGVNPDYTPLHNFMPSLTIPSEQLITAFSRLMRRELYEAPESKDYYELHFNTMYNLGLVDEKVIKADSKLADFVLIAGRALDKEQLVLGEVKVDLECKTGDTVGADCEKKEEKKSGWFW